MASTKISDMTSASDLVAAFVPIVQAGTNKKAAITLFKNNLSELDDVSVYELNTGDVLIYNELTQRWESQTLYTRVQSVTSSSTVTPNASNDDMVKITAQAAALLLANPTGTPYEGQMIVIRIKDNGTARAITFDTQYRAMGITLPTTTVLSKTMYLPMVYNSTDTKWDVFNVIQEA